MSTLESIQPDSRLGVPLHPFFPGMKWNTTREMVEEILDDLTIPWVQEYVLRSHPRQDVHALSDPMKYSRSLSNVLDCATIPAESGGFVSTVRTVRLDIPVLSTGNIGVGISVEDSNHRDTEQLIYLKGLQFSRFVSNNHRNTQLIIRFLQDLGKVIVSYSIYGEDGVWVYVNLHAEYTQFLSAFTTNSSTVDFDAINQSIIQSIVSFCPFHRKPVVAANHLYPNKVSDLIGDHFLHNIVCLYSGGHPVKILPIYSHVSLALNYNAIDLRRMQNWGITDRLQRLPASLIRNPKMSINEFLLSEDCEPHQVISETARNFRTQLYASPLPTRAAIRPRGNNLPQDELRYPDPAVIVLPGNCVGSSSNRTVSIAPRAEPISRPRKPQDEMEQRKELRKIRKREAAARSYQRKLVARGKRQANSAQKKT